MQLAPIALFVYNRPDHTKKTLDALMQNDLISSSQIYIFSDQASSIENDVLVQEVRTLIRTYQWPIPPIIIERVENYGLAKNIVTGINHVLSENDRIIILEDDIITSKGFLTYMNQALQLYANEDRVMHLSGYMFPLKKELPETFFYNTTSCWGWGTWSSSWLKYEANTNVLLSHFNSEKIITQFNIGQSYDFHGDLVANHTRTLSTWAVKWYASVFINGGYCLHPGKSLTLNIGHDGTGVNSSATTAFDHAKLPKSVAVKPLNIAESKYVRRLMSHYYKKNHQNYLGRVKGFVSGLMSEEIKQYLKTFSSKKNRATLHEIKKLKNTPRFVASTSTLIGPTLSFNDAASMLFNYHEIFEQGVYDFKTLKSNPLIIDAGANIGLSTIRFKTLYPDARIIAIEADHEVIQHLKTNIDSFKLGNVEAIEAAVWSSSCTMYFDATGADSGHVSNEPGTPIKAILLSELIKEEVEMIKMDIEGAELEVIKEVKHKLHLVKNLFIQFHSFIGESQKLSEILQILESSNFRYYISSPGVSQKKPLLKNNYSYIGMDFQVNIHAIRK
jgi:FkbM family methyltransferase